MKEFNTKKEIRDIMLEMESLSEKQIATTLTEETLKELMESNGFNAINAGFREADPTCTPDCGDCVNTINFCCKTTIDAGFTVTINPALTTIQYTSNLFCFTDPCPCPVTVTPGAGCPSFCITLYPRRVIGCIDFRAFTGNAVGDACAGGLCAGTLNGAICCEGSQSVNNIVSYQQCPPTLSEAQPKSIPTSSLIVTVAASKESCSGGTGPCDSTVVKFSGTFEVPEVCPTPSCLNTPCPTVVCPTACPPTPTCTPSCCS
ncbi:hypothetical protein G9F72_008630 [Clostridium estertheticum]|uniref:hypothetical protein n=1 Tax=Clostridium estertheticum TaxID=238834 RepID=UPI0013E96004|nr:hypothetical protein [Clostridium estertheticum]MBN4049314.1 hypothetical protein [bacterium AH-315-N14]MBZ9686393.1 hypothetical protein [Clostridium estertheticum]